MADQSLNRRSNSRRSRLGESGQALVETAIFLPVYLLIIYGLFFFGEAYVNKIRVNQAARYAGMIYITGAERSTVEAALADSYFADCGQERFTVCDRYQGECTGDEDDTLWDSFGDLFSGATSPEDMLLTALNNSIFPVVSKAEVEFQLLNPFAPTGREPFTENSYTLKAQWTIQGNPWAWEETDGVTLADVLVGLLWDIAGPVLEPISAVLGEILEWDILPAPMQDILELIFTDPR